MARGEHQPMPFHLRWFLPWACGERTAAWLAVNVIATLAAGALTAVLALQHGATEIQAGMAALLLLGLPFVNFTWFCPVLVDMPGLAFALGAAVLWPVSPWAALGVCLLGGAVSEKTPVWAAVFSLQPLLLVGLVMPLVRWLFTSAGQINPLDPLAWTLDQRVAGLKAHIGHWRDPFLMVLPWGACLIVLAQMPPLGVVLALAVGYAQLLVATDTVRLYQQAAPVVCIAAATQIPQEWFLPVLVAHWFNPWKTEGL
jgi:hypothetical protein